MWLGKWCYGCGPSCGFRAETCRATETIVRALTTDSSFGAFEMSATYTLLQCHKYGDHYHP